MWGRASKRFLMLIVSYIFIFFLFSCLQQESGGTVLSTNWKDIGKEKTECKPPDGMEFKNWEYWLSPAEGIQCDCVVNSRQSLFSEFYCEYCR